MNNFIKCGVNPKGWQLINFSHTHPHTHIHPPTHTLTHTDLLQAMTMYRDPSTKNPMLEKMLLIALNVNPEYTSHG